MLLNILINRNLIKRYIDDYLNYVSIDIYNDIKNMSIKDFISTFLKNIHTYKGVFLQWNMINLGHKLDKLENEVESLKNNPELNKNFLIAFLKNKKMEHYADVELNYIKKRLGKNFFSEEIYSISKKQLLELEKKIKEYVPQKYSQLIISEIRKLYLDDFKKIFELYKKYTIKLAKKFGKEISSFIIDVDSKISIDAEFYYDFNKNLIHIFRNIVIHGIETPDERLRLNKSEGGNIKCKVYEDNDYLHITISDDGKGIKIQNNNSNNDIYTVFNEGFSTVSNSNEYAGKGLGLSAIKDNIEKYGGKILLSSEENQGTTVEILLPKYFHNKN
ncbi:ATP-binding protein [Marinitoga lauensis]|uniref:ATP-binding protein n=1 Tax=Marinitoga lauensis TaxID=2201189 RepID=UPI00197E4FC2|nr:ATP-binding protein [Marinitoga lauensis]